MMNKEEILRQLQSRIDKRSNEITEVEDFYKNDCGIMVAIADHEKDYLYCLRWEQTLDKRIYGLILRMDNHCFELECALITALDVTKGSFLVA